MIQLITLHNYDLLGRLTFVLAFRKKLRPHSQRQLSWQLAKPQLLTHTGYSLRSGKRFADGILQKKSSNFCGINPQSVISPSRRPRAGPHTNPRKFGGRTVAPARGSILFLGAAFGESASTPATPRYPLSRCPGPKAGLDYLSTRWGTVPRRRLDLPPACVCRLFPPVACSTCLRPSVVWWESSVDGATAQAGEEEEGDPLDLVPVVGSWRLLLWQAKEQQQQVLEVVVSL